MWGGYNEELFVYSPEKLIEYPGARIIISTEKYYIDIMNEIKQLGVENERIELFRFELSEEVKNGLNKRTIDLGDFLYKQNCVFTCKELTFIPGGSGILDYIFIKTIAQISGVKEYLEIGTYIGESINNLSDCCEKLYSVTAAVDAPYSSRSGNRQLGLPDYTERLTNDKKVIHYFVDSKQFDFSKHRDTVDLYFIDGDHSYDGVLCDTKNIFANKKEDAIVIWHDFKIDNQYRAETINAVKDVLEKDFENVYVTNNNMCGIYIPKTRMEEFHFKMREMKYEENAPLYTYDITLKNIQIK